MDQTEQLKQLELKLLDPGTRSSFEEISKLLNDNFKEISKNGKIYNKQDVLNHLPTEKGDREFRTEEWDFNIITPDVRIINYITSESDDNFEEKTLRTSIWKHENKIWKMIFHQGTKKSSN